MKQTLFVLVLIALIVPFTIVVAQAATKHTIITNDDNPSGGGNTATVFSFNNKTGDVKQTTMLYTGGYGLGRGYFAQHSISITTNKKCLYVIDAGSGDIAAFTGPKGKYAKVGNYTSSNSLWGAYGGSLAITPDDKALYSANSGSENLSQWTINSDCSLTHVQDYTPSTGSDYFGEGLVVSHSGKFLLLSASDYGWVEMYGINSDHSLTDNGAAYFNTFSQCTDGCYPAGIAITSDDTAIAIANEVVSPTSMFVANTSSTGTISNQALVSLTSSPQLTNPQVPQFEPLTSKGKTDCTAKSKKCWLFMGMSGYGSSNPGGVTVLSFNLAKISRAKVKSAKQFTGSTHYYATMSKVGDWAVSGGDPGVLAAAKFNYTKGTLGTEVDSVDLNTQSTILAFEAF